MEMPFSYLHFNNPELACAELGRQNAESIYLNQVEYLYQNYRGYPPDWKWRIYFAKKHAHGQCQRCQDKRSLTQRTKRRHDTHHIFRVGEIVSGKKIFDHTFGPGGNLQYLCDECHQDEHPDKQIVEPEFFEG